MAKYQILARKPLGPSGTGPKQTIEVKTVSQQRLGVAARRRTAACTACGTGPHAARATAPLATVHRTLSSSIVDGRQLRRGRRPRNQLEHDEPADVNQLLVLKRNDEPAGTGIEELAEEEEEEDSNYKESFIAVDSVARISWNDSVLYSQSADKAKRKEEATSYEEASNRKLLFISRELQCNQQMLLELAIAKRCRLHKLIRQRFARGDVLISELP
ncbi:interactor of constitutive active ROPs 2, chloroplastic-like [Dorcoceras hygrometricum]|uniref:Interactor of constitutive active ROPs 2, chloroplastic-like n=1 Tax=Dorcoceras hygrometricum TaxID=472368 RepID=A0A2Z7AC76_9LAMI|nr:interactor of constitutive active ROPs 2, chloroplastic-like [Dorcoceras hygrometricum]